MSYRQELEMRIERTKHIVTIAKGEFGSQAADMLADLRKVPPAAKLITWEESDDGRIVELIFEEERGRSGAQSERA